MDGMDHGGDSTMMGMSSMSMTFFSSLSTPFLSTLWTPTTQASYAATCIFIAVLCIVFRALLAYRSHLEMRWMDAEFNRRYVSVVGKPTKAERLAADSDSKRMILTENGVEEDVMVVKRRSRGIRPWRLSVDPVRACVDTVVAGVGYLLMLAVMTMNIGYFLSVLAGTFVASLALGRYAPLEH